MTCDECGLELSWKYKEVEFALKVFEKAKAMKNYGDAMELMHFANKECEHGIPNDDECTACLKNTDLLHD